VQDLVSHDPKNALWQQDLQEIVALHSAINAKL